MIYFEAKADAVLAVVARKKWVIGQDYDSEREVWHEGIKALRLKSYWLKEPGDERYRKDRVADYFLSLESFPISSEEYVTLEEQRLSVLTPDGKLIARSRQYMLKDIAQQAEYADCDSLVADDPMQRIQLRPNYLFLRTLFGVLPSVVERERREAESLASSRLRYRRSLGDQVDGMDFSGVGKYGPNWAF